MDRSSWMIGDRAREARKRGKACAFGVLYREVSCNSIVQMIK